MMKARSRLGWIFVLTGLLFLLCGLIVTIFATVPHMTNSPMKMMAIDWTPSRVGIFFIIVGMVLEGTGAYALMSVTQAK